VLELLALLELLELLELLDDGVADDAGRSCSGFCQRDMWRPPYPGGTR